MIIIGDHKQTDKKFKYEYYQKDKTKEDFNTEYKTNSNRKLVVIKHKLKLINYNTWFKSLLNDRANLLKHIGIKDPHVLKSFSTMPFNILPNEVIRKLQTKVCLCCKV
jgi:hypothetical protein